MQRLYDGVAFSKGSFVSPKLELTLKRQRNSIESMKRYYRENYVLVSNSSLLIKAIYKLSSYIGGSRVAALNSLDENLKDITASLRFVTSSNFGNVFDSDFSGEEGTVIIGAPHYSQAELITVTDWKALVPLRVVSRDGVDGSLLRPDLREEAEGATVVTLDLKALLVMLSLWMVENNKRPIGEQQTLNEFLGRYVYVNAMDSQMDCIMVNILRLIPEEVEVLKLSTYPSVASNKDYMVLLIEEMQELKEKYAEKSQDFLATIGHIPSYTKDSIKDSVPTINVAATTYNYWALQAAYVNVTEASLIVGASDPEINSTRNTFRRINRHMKSVRTFEKIKHPYFRKWLQDRYMFVMFRLDDAKN